MENMSSNFTHGGEYDGATFSEEVYDALSFDNNIASALAQTHQSDTVRDTAKKAFGIDYLFPWQRLVIANILDAAEALSCAHHISDKSDETKIRKDAAQQKNVNIESCNISDYNAMLGKQIVLLPTGAGKSLCFLVPALLLDGATLIIYPLLALMADQKRRIESGSLESVTFRGNQTHEEREENFAKIKNGAKIIIANPEVLQNETLLARLSECNITHIAIDEAHCVSEWGDSFRPTYLTLGKIIKKIHAPIVTAFTATASPHVLTRISDVLFDGEARIVRSEADRQNICYHVLNSYCKKQTALMLARTEQRPMILFCGTRLHAEDMARELNVCYGNETARFYHAGMEKTEKDEIEKWFFKKNDTVLCATCAYGMGVDKKDIRTIIHLDVPHTVEQYIQEAGRSGRDGLDAKAVLLWSPEDSKKFSQFAKGSREYTMKEFAETKECRRQVLLNALDAEQAVCSGCDLCDARKHADTSAAGEKRIAAQHATSSEQIAFNFITAHRKRYSKTELIGKLLPILNECARNTCGKNTWEHSAIEELLHQLKIAGKIRIMKFPWKYKITIVKEKQLYTKNFSQKMHTVQLKITSRIVPHIIKPSHQRHLIQRHRHLLRKRG